MTEEDALKRAEALITLGWHKNPEKLAEALVEAAREGLTPRLPPRHFPAGKCRVCGWPLVERVQDGCTKTSCSQRPVPEWRADKGFAPAAEPLDIEGSPAALLEKAATVEKAWPDVPDRRDFDSVSYRRP